jgi:hypothetical protein
MCRTRPPTAVTMTRHHRASQILRKVAHAIVLSEDDAAFDDHAGDDEA